MHVLMAVVQIRPVRVHMLQRGVDVGVRMPAVFRVLLMNMQVVTIRVGVPMLVFLYQMLVSMPMLLVIKQSNRSSK